jgi:hypothetical protein
VVTDGGILCPAGAACSLSPTMLLFIAAQFTTWLVHDGLQQARVVCQ